MKTAEYLLPMSGHATEERAWHDILACEVANDFRGKFLSTPVRFFGNGPNLSL
jgi:hypothetical protein